MLSGRFGSYEPDEPYKPDREPVGAGNRFGRKADFAAVCCQSLYIVCHAEFNRNFLAKIEILVKTEILLKNHSLGQKSKCWSKIEILVKN